MSEAPCHDNKSWTELVDSGYGSAQCLHLLVHITHTSIATKGTTCWCGGLDRGGHCRLTTG